MSTSSGSSTISGTAYGMPLLARRPSVDINVNGHYTSKVYTTGSPVSGEVVITPSRDVRFDQVQIILLGTTKTRLEALQVPSQSSHTFLKLAMPISDSAYPTPRIFEAGQSYTIPFNFVIPGYLTVSACNHQTVSDLIRDYHMRLPPSVGSWERDDLAPRMVRVEYSIKARITAEPDVGGRPVRLMEASHGLNVLPTSPEEPPLSITKHDKNYCMAKTKSLRKNLWSAKIGRLAAAAAQPAPAMLSPDGRAASGTSVHVDLKFVPVTADAVPPKINSVTAKLVASTYYSANPITKLPDLGTGRYDYANDQLLSFQSSIALSSSAGVESVAWRQQLNPQVRRDSGYATDSAEERAPRAPKKSRAAPLFHTASLSVPLRLPAKKMLLPTFHSCLASRVYAVQLTLSVGASNTSLTLTLPLQVGVEAGAYGADYLFDAGLPSFDAVVAAQEAAEVDEYLRPRLLQVPAPELQQMSVLPGYADLGFRRR